MINIKDITKDNFALMINLSNEQNHFYGTVDAESITDKCTYAEFDCKFSNIKDAKCIIYDLGLMRNFIILENGLCFYQYGISDSIILPSNFDKISKILNKYWQLHETTV